MTFLIILILVLVSFFFSTAETSIIGLSKIRLRHMLSKGSRRARSIHNLITQSDLFITGILVGNNFVNIGISALITGLMIGILGYRWGVFAATVIAGSIILILCEITPKILAMKNSEAIASFCAPVMEAFIRVFRPLIIFFMRISTTILRLLRINPGKRSPLITEEELRLMIEVGKEEGVLSDEERKMLHRIFEFGDLQLKDVMSPKEKVVAVNVEASPDDLLNIFAEQGHSRLPVYSGTIDTIIGVIYARDLLYILRDTKLFLLQDLIHDATFVNTSMRVNDLLRKFQQENIQIAIVVDQHKKTLGIVTLEDLLEEIVGEIEEQRPLFP
jgi:putative hemolysin